MRWSQQFERLPVFGSEYAIATSHPTASAIGLSVLASGGNAVDAALAAHAVLCVVEPGMTGAGGDCFVLYYDAAKEEVIGLNGSGYAPAAQSSDVTREQLHPSSAIAVTVPGAVDAWCRLARDYATRSLEELFQPAIGLAEGGYPVHARVAWDFANEAARLALNPAAARTFLPGGRAPLPGERQAQPRLARTLSAIARKGRDAFYEGEIAEDIVRTLGDLGGAHSLDDMAGYSSEYVQPIATSFAGHRIVECPPNGQGVIALLVLNILRDAIAGHAPVSDADYIHLLAEATKLAYNVRDSVLADERHLPESVESLLSAERGARLAGSIGPTATPAAACDSDMGSNTTYLCAVDRNGNCISFINSLFYAFGSCIVAPKSGVLLNNRGMGFSLQPGHPNHIGPAKRPMHTIIPGMIMTEAGRPVGPFGVMGGDYQAAGHADFIVKLLLRGMNAQQAINTPRTFAAEGVLRVEPTLAEPVAADLARRGHKIVNWGKPIGGAQAIVIDRDRGTLLAASDPRKDGCALSL